MAKTTNFIVDGSDYFAAHLDTGGIRVGMKGLAALDVPADHSFYAEAYAIKDEADAEVFYDKYVGPKSLTVWA